MDGRRYVLRVGSEPKVNAMQPKDEASESRLAWGVDLLACGYFVWSYFNLNYHTSTLAPMIAGLGATVPRSTAFVLANHSWLLPAVFGGAGVAAVGKERWVRDKRMSVCITFAIAIAVLWLSDYLKSVLFLPMLDLIKQLQ